MLATYAKRMAGFSLLEVMVALVIIAVGMLGIAKMQGLALSSTTASRSRALAAIEASSLAAAMQANRSYWSNSASTPGTITVTTSAGLGSVTSTDGAMQTAINNATGSLCSGMGTNLSCYCTPSVGSCTNSINMAASDLYDFAQSLGSFLPTSTTTITCNAANSPVDCTIFILWNENTVAMTSKEAQQSLNAGSTVQVTFTLNVIP